MRVTRKALLELIEMADGEGIGILTNQPDNVNGKRAFDLLVRAGLAKPTKETQEFKITPAGRQSVARACAAASVIVGADGRLRKKRRRS